ncbi:MAG TPA: hypothetical protein VGJ01_21030 [Pseudolabrys sp.]
MTTRVSSLSFLVPSVSARLDQCDVQFPRGVGDDQHLLEECAEDDDGDLRPVIDAQDRHGQGAEGRCRQIAEEFDERLVDAGEGRVGAAENAERHADDGRDHEAPKDDLDAVPQALIKPRAIRCRRRRDECGVQRHRHLVRRRQIDRIAADALGRVLVLALRLRHGIGEGVFVHAHPDLQIID